MKGVEPGRRPQKSASENFGCVIRVRSMRDERVSDFGGMRVMTLDSERLLIRPADGCWEWLNDDNSARIRNAQMWKSYHD